MDQATDGREGWISLVAVHTKILSLLPGSIPPPESPPTSASKRAGVDPRRPIGDQAAYREK